MGHRSGNQESAIEVGRRYTRRLQLSGGLERIDVEAHHIFSGAIVRYKNWALQYLEEKNISARKITEDALLAGWVNEGAALREHVALIVGTESDDGISLAARIYELCRLIEEFQLLSNK